MTLVLMLLLGLWLLLIAGLWSTAKMLLQPPRMTAGKALYLLKRITPDDLGLRYEPIEFVVRDGHSGETMKLAGWWLPHPAGGSKTVVMIHGYADAKVGAIAWAPPWQQLGYNIVAYDQRAHGDSEGRYCTGGVFEREDLMQVLDQLHERFARSCTQLALFGISLGASPALAAAGRRDDLHAVVCECPFRDYPSAVAGLSRQLDLPLPKLLPTVLRLGAWISKADLHRVDNLPLMRDAKCPLLIIEAEFDPFVSRQDADAIAQIVSGRRDGSESWFVAGSSHLRALELNPQEYLKRLRGFLISPPSQD